MIGAELKKKRKSNEEFSLKREMMGAAMLLDSTELRIQSATRWVATLDRATTIKFLFTEN